MTQDETRRILAVFAAAYPAQYKHLDNESTNLITALWTQQFAAVPYDIVTLAVSREIASNKFAPTIAEIKSRLHEINQDARIMALEGMRGLRKLTPEEKKRIDYIMTYTESKSLEPGILGVEAQQRTAIGGNTK